MTLFFTLSVDFVAADDRLQTWLALWQIGKGLYRCDTLDETFVYRIERLYGWELHSLVDFIQSKLEVNYISIVW